MWKYEDGTTFDETVLLPPINKYYINIDNYLSDLERSETIVSKPKRRILCCFCC